MMETLKISSLNTLKCQINGSQSRFQLSKMIGEFVANLLRKFRLLEINFVIVMIHCHLVNNLILSKIFLMRSDWLEFSAK